MAADHCSPLLVLGPITLHASNGSLNTSRMTPDARTACKTHWMVSFLVVRGSDNMVFTLRPPAHLPTLSTRAGLGTISRSSGIARFVQGGVVKTFRWQTQAKWQRPSNSSRTTLFTFSALGTLSRSMLRGARTVMSIESVFTTNVMTPHSRRIARKWPPQSSVLSMLGS